MIADSPVFSRRYGAEAAELAGTLSASRRVGPQEFEADLDLRVGLFRRRVPMRLLLHGACTAGVPLTVAELLPERSVRQGRAYFNAGNRLLDGLRPGL